MFLREEKSLPINKYIFFQSIELREKREKWMAKNGFEKHYDIPDISHLMNI